MVLLILIDTRKLFFDDLVNIYKLFLLKVSHLFKDIYVETFLEVAEWLRSGL